MPDFWQELSERGCGRLVVLAPHPDDEVFGVGGIMALSKQRGFALTVLAVTDGEASHARSTAVSREQLRERRQQEIESAYEALGVEPRRVRLGLPDGGVADDQLAALVGPYVTSDAVVLSPPADDGHPDHEACGRVATALAGREGAMFYAYPIWAFSRGAERLDQACPIEVLLPAGVREAKRRAMDCFVSQLEALGPAPEDGPVLPPGFRGPFLRPFEVLYR